MKWLRWKAFFFDILDKHAPITRIKVKGNSLSYVTSELKALIRTRDYLRAKLTNKTGSVCLRKAFNHVRNKATKHCQTCNKAIMHRELKRIKII